MLAAYSVQFGGIEASITGVFSCNMKVLMFSIVITTYWISAVQTSVECAPQPKSEYS